MNHETLLLRQVSPSWIQDGRATSQAFTPTPKDERRLSVYNGDQITPGASWDHFTGELGFESFGVLAVTVQECQDAETTVTPDPVPYPEHVVIDFTELPSNSKVRAVGQQLTKRANERGWQYVPINRDAMTG